MEEFFAEVENGVEGVTVVSPYTEAGARQVAQDGTIAYAEVNFTDRPSSDYPTAATKILDLKDEIDVEGLEGRDGRRHLRGRGVRKQRGRSACCSR